MSFWYHVLQCVHDESYEHLHLINLFSNDEIDVSILEIYENIGKSANK